MAREGAQIPVAAVGWRFRERGGGEAAGGPEPAQPESVFTLNEELTRIQDPAGGPELLRAPREHQVLPQRVRGQALAVMTEEDAQARLSLEGAVVQRLECRPAAGNAT